jgi:hypothetical protein
MIIIRKIQGVTEIRHFSELSMAMCPEDAEIEQIYSTAKFESLTNS